MWPSIGLCWGTVRQTSLPELIDVASAYGFPTITVPPVIIERCLASGVTAFILRQRLRETGIRVTVIDALTRDLPGAPAIDELPPLWRDNWKYGLDDLMDMADALEAPVINATHYLGKPVTPAVMAEAIAVLAQRARGRGLKLSLEFIPNTSIGCLSTAADIVRMAGADNVGITLDTWHFLRSGGSARDIRALPPGSLMSVQVNDRLAEVEPATRDAIGDRSLPGEGVAPLTAIMQAILGNSPDVSIEVETFSSDLTAMPLMAAGKRVARAIATWQRGLGPL